MNEYKLLSLDDALERLQMYGEHCNISVISTRNAEHVLEKLGAKGIIVHTWWNKDRLNIWHTSNTRHIYVIQLRMIDDQIYAELYHEHIAPAPNYVPQSFTVNKPVLANPIPRVINKVIVGLASIVAIFIGAWWLL